MECWFPLIIASVGVRIIFTRNSSINVDAERCVCDQVLSLLNYYRWFGETDNFDYGSWSYDPILWPGKLGSKIINVLLLEINGCIAILYEMNFELLSLDFIFCLELFPGHSSQ